MEYDHNGSYVLGKTKTHTSPVQAKTMANDDVNDRMGY